MPRVITIDGPAGAGKTTTAKGIAGRLGFHHVNTGAVYRALAVWHRGNPDVPFEANDVSAKLIRDRDAFVQSMYSGGECVDEYLYEGAVGAKESVSELSSRISERREVRDAANRIIRDMCSGHDVIVEGRDTGSVLFPDATLRIFLTASSAVRAGRMRAGDGDGRTLEERVADLEKRDYRDAHREIDPLVQAPGMILINNDSASLDETIDLICGLWAARLRALRGGGT